MCLYPKLIKNPKYVPNKKNNYNAPTCSDERTMYVPIACGACIECMKKKSREWQIRLNEELKSTNYKNAHFVTLTFSNEELQKLCEEKKNEESNYIATIAVRRFLERYRKEFKKSIKHFLITELGHNNTERIHLHGILWGDKEKIAKHWKYGYIDFGQYVNEKSVNYIVKYITKLDPDHKGYKPIILCSKGIGKIYIEKPISLKHKFSDNTIEEYKLNSGDKIALPIYYRNYLFTEEQREKLWLNKLDKQERWVMGVKINVSTEEGMNKYFHILKNAQEKNKRLGYGDDSKEWEKKSYNVTIHKIRKLTKIKEYNEKKMQKNLELSKKNI